MQGNKVITLLTKKKEITKDRIIYQGISLRADNSKRQEEK